MYRKPLDYHMGLFAYIFPHLHEYTHYRVKAHKAKIQHTTTLCYRTSRISTKIKAYKTKHHTLPDRPSKQSSTSMPH